MPAPMVGEEQTGGQAQHLAGGKCGLDIAHHPAAHLEVEQVGGDGQHDRPDHPAEQPGDDARQQQHGIGGGQGAQQCAQHEAGIEEQQQALPVEAVGKARRHDARQSGGEGIGTHRQAELLRGDAQVRHHHRAQRRDDHEVQDQGELQKGQRGDDKHLVARETRALGLYRGVHVLLPRDAAPL